MDGGGGTSRLCNGHAKGRHIATFRGIRGGAERRRQSDVTRGDALALRLQALVVQPCRRQLLGRTLGACRSGSEASCCCLCLGRSETIGQGVEADAGSAGGGHRLTYQRQIMRRGHCCAGRDLRGGHRIGRTTTTGEPGRAQHGSDDQDEGCAADGIPLNAMSSCDVAD